MSTQTQNYHIFICYTCDWYAGEKGEPVPFMRFGIAPDKEISAKAKILTLIEAATFIPDTARFIPVYHFPVYETTPADDLEKTAPINMLLFPVNMNPTLDASSRILRVPQGGLFTYKVNQAIPILSVDEETGVPYPDILLLDSMVRYEFNPLMDLFESLAMDHYKLYKNNKGFAQIVGEICIRDKSYEVPFPSPYKKSDTKSKIINIQDFLQRS